MAQRGCCCAPIHFFGGIFCFVAWVLFVVIVIINYILSKVYWLLRLILYEFPYGLVRKCCPGSITLKRKKSVAIIGAGPSGIRYARHITSWHVVCVWFVGLFVFFLIGSSACVLCRFECSNVTTGLFSLVCVNYSLANLLAEQSLCDVIVFEKNRYVGGKAFTHTYEGLGHEMGTQLQCVCCFAVLWCSSPSIRIGACYITEGYTHCVKWMKKYGVERFRLLKHRLLMVRSRIWDDHALVIFTVMVFLCMVYWN